MSVKRFLILFLSFSSYGGPFLSGTMGSCNIGRGNLYFCFYYIIANYNFLEDVMLVVIVLLGVFLHSALGGNAIQVTQSQIGKFR